RFSKRSMVISSNRGVFILGRLKLARNLLSVLGTFGSGHGARIPRTQARDQRLARLANITQSSCATSSYCVAARVQRPLRTSGRPTAISFHLRHAGNSPAFAWPRTHDNNSFKKDASPGWARSAATLTELSLSPALPRLRGDGRREGFLFFTRERLNA